MCFKSENIEDKYFKNSITAYTHYNGDKNEALNSSRRDYFSNNMSDISWCEVFCCIC